MTIQLTRRSALALAAGVGAWASAGLARGQGPAGPMRLIVPFPAGGTADALPRILAEKVRGAFPVGVVVENRAGAGGNIGAEYVARAQADGTVFLAAPPGPVAINHHLYKSLNFDPARWTPVTVIATVPNVLAVSNQLPVRTVADLVAYAGGNPEKVTYASQGNGSTSHLTACMFMQKTGVKMVHIPYKGTAPAQVDLQAGNVDLFFDNLSSSAPHHAAGRLRILAVADTRRSPMLPQVPTLREAGVDMEAITFFSIVAPPGTPREAVTHAHRRFSEALAAPDVKQRFLEMGAVAAGWSPERTGEFVRAESERWSRVIKSAGVILE